MAEETAGTDSQPACLLDGLTDDYEYCHEDLPAARHEDKMVLYVLGLREILGGIGLMSCAEGTKPKLPLLKVVKW